MFSVESMNSSEGNLVKFSLSNFSEVKSFDTIQVTMKSIAMEKIRWVM